MSEGNTTSNPRDTLLQRLRSGTFDEYSGDEDLKNEAADEIERLTKILLTDDAAIEEVQAENQRLRAALQKYGDHLRKGVDHQACGYWDTNGPQECTCGLEAAGYDSSDFIRAADETSRCQAGLKGYTRCKLSMGHSGDCDYEDLL